MRSQALTAAKDHAAGHERQPSWSNTVAWLQGVRESTKAEAKALLPLLEPWDTALSSWGGDPVRDNWELFRPLRLSREEDWSDWLGVLLRGPEGRSVAKRLFAPAEQSVVVEDVLREAIVLEGQRRADLILLWSENRASHVEVKVWDRNFDKTAETGQGSRTRFDKRRDWADYILLPDESEEACRESDGCRGVSVVTWTSVTRELRRVLLQQSGSYQWIAFARAFCGAVEQKILGVPWMPPGKAEFVRSAGIFRFGSVLRDAKGDHSDGYGD